MVLTGGGDCPGLNAVIQGVVMRAHHEADWEILGSIQAYNGILREPQQIVNLTPERVAGIHATGGTIIHTTNKGGPFEWPVPKNDGGWEFVDRSDELIRKLKYLGVEGVISIGGDGSAKISQKLFEKGMPVIGVPKTIDNDLMATDFTFGFQTAVQIATEAVDKLISTAASHNRVMILEVMGRDAGWIALSSAIAGGADIALIPEIPYDLDKVASKVKRLMLSGKGYGIIVVAEGAKNKQGDVIANASTEIGYAHKHLGGIGNYLQEELKKLVDVDIRVTILGHLQRGGSPAAYDRILATQFGVHAFEMVLAKKFGEMVVYQHPKITSVPIQEAISKYNVIEYDHALVKTARGLHINLGD